MLKYKPINFNIQVLPGEMIRSGAASWYNNHLDDRVSKEQVLSEVLDHFAGASGIVNKNLDRLSVSECDCLRMKRHKRNSSVKCELSCLILNGMIQILIYFFMNVFNCRI